MSHALLLLIAVFTARAAGGQVSLAYVPNFSDDTVSVIDPATNTVVQTVSVGDQPRAVAIHPSGAVVYIANEGTSDDVSIIDATTHAVIDTIPFNALVGGQAALEVSPDGRTLYVGGVFDGIISTHGISVVDVQSTAVTDHFAVGAIGGLAINATGTRLYATEFAGNDLVVIATATNSIIDTIPIGTTPQALALSEDGTTAYTANVSSGDVSVIDLDLGMLIDSITVGGLPRGLALHPDGTRLYVASEQDSTLTVINTATNGVIDTLTLDLSGPFGVATHPAGTAVYVTNLSFTPSVSVIDTITHTLITSIPVGNTPTAKGRFIRAHTPPIFIDGFESGDTTAWSVAVP